MKINEFQEDAQSEIGNLINTLFQKTENEEIFWKTEVENEDYRVSIKENEFRIAVVENKYPTLLVKEQGHRIYFFEFPDDCKEREKLRSLLYLITKQNKSSVAFSLRRLIKSLND